MTISRRRFASFPSPYLDRSASYYLRDLHIRKYSVLFSHHARRLTLGFSLDQTSSASSYKLTDLCLLARPLYSKACWFSLIFCALFSLIRRSFLVLGHFGSLHPATSLGLKRRYALVWLKFSFSFAFLLASYLTLLFSHARPLQVSGLRSGVSYSWIMYVPSLTLHWMAASRGVSPNECVYLINTWTLDQRLDEFQLYWTGVYPSTWHKLWPRSDIWFSRAYKRRCTMKSV